jgi:hypothetical protein
VVWRGVPRTIDRTAFWWEAPDGTRVLAEYLPYGYFIGGGLSGAKDAKELATGFRHAVSLLSPMSLRDALLVSVGGDHHGPDPNLPRLLHEARAEAPDIAAEVGSIADHVDEPVENGLPEWRGELRSAARAHLLPGVCSNRAHQKRERARVEALVERYAEPLAALVPGFTWPQDAFDRIWQLLLWNGAHDSVCGCSVDEVARDVDTRYEEARRLAEDITHKALVSLGAQVPAAGVLQFNPSPFEREGVPSLGWRVEPTEVVPRTIPLDVAIDGGGIVVDGTRLSLFDEPDVGDLYNFCPVESAKLLGPTDVTLDGQQMTARFFNDLEVEIVFSRREEEPCLRLDGTIRNTRPDHRLRLHVALPQQVTSAMAGAPFELVERGLVSEGSDLEAPSPTWPARGVVLAGGVAVLAEGVFEYEVVDGQELAVTLLRCVGTISRAHLATRPSPAGPDIATPDAQMIGDTHFALGVYPNATDRQLMRAWERFALPLVSAPASGDGSLAASGSLLEISGAELSSVRRVNGRTEVRIWNPSSRHVLATVDGQTVQMGPAAIATQLLGSR